MSDSTRLRLLERFKQEPSPENGLEYLIHVGRTGEFGEKEKAMADDLVFSGDITLEQAYGLKPFYASEEEFANRNLEAFEDQHKLLPFILRSYLKGHGAKLRGLNVPYIDKTKGVMDIVFVSNESLDSLCTLVEEFPLLREGSFVDVHKFNDSSIINSYPPHLIGCPDPEINLDDVYIVLFELNSAKYLVGFTTPEIYEAENDDLLEEVIQSSDLDGQISENYGLIGGIEYGEDFFEELTSFSDHAEFFEGDNNSNYVLEDELDLSPGQGVNPNYISEDQYWDSLDDESVVDNYDSFDDYDHSEWN